MCELPKRRWRSSLTPLRLVLAVLAVAAIVAGWLVPDLLSALPIGAGLLTFAVAVLMPAIREIELGASPSIKLAPALKDREDELRSVFERQKGDMEYCAHLLCDNAETARSLLEAAWSQSTNAWKGPVTPQLRVYTLCVFVELLKKHEHWLQSREGKTKGTKGPKTKNGKPPLARLSFDERVAVVLHVFANLTVGEIAGMTDRPALEVGKSLAAAEEKTNRLALEEGRP